MSINFPMVHAPHSPEADELLAQYPELARARALYIELFRNLDFLQELGYKKEQIDYAEPSIKLLAENGRMIIPETGDPYLHFGSSTFEGDVLDISYLPSHDGFCMKARRLVRGVLSKLPFAAFEETEEMVVQMALFNAEAPTNDLNYLIPQLCGYLTQAPLGIIPDTDPVAQILRIQGLGGTYRGSWISKEEFMASVGTPEDYDFGLYSSCFAFRRLPSFSDNWGTMIPFGRMANVSPLEIEERLDRLRTN